MNLNMTSIKDAWGVSDISSTEPERVNKPFFKHPNAITDSRPTRIDVALFDKDLLTELFPHTPEYRTKLVTERLTMERLHKTQKTQKPPPPPRVEEEPPQKEYFHIPTLDSRYDLTTILLLTFFLLLLDKMSTIWTNS